MLFVSQRVDIGVGQGKGDVCVCSKATLVEGLCYLSELFVVDFNIRRKILELKLEFIFEE